MGVQVYTGLLEVEAQVKMPPGHQMEHKQAQRPPLQIHLLIDYQQVLSSLRKHPWLKIYHSMHQYILLFHQATRIQPLMPTAAGMNGFRALLEN